MKNIMRGVWERVSVAKVKFDRDGEGGREVLRIGSCSINI